MLYFCFKNNKSACPFKTPDAGQTILSTYQMLKKRLNFPWIKLNIIIIIIIAVQPFVGPWPFFQFLDPIPWTGDQPVARPLPTHRTT
jgi:hypothetical protein